MICLPRPQFEVFEISSGCLNLINNRDKTIHNFFWNSLSEFTNPISTNCTKRKDVLRKHSVNIGNLAFSNGVLLVKRRFYKQIS